MRARMIAAALLPILLGGCVHKTAYLTKPPTTAGADVQIAHCEAKGFGLIPLVLEEVSYDDCMAFYRNHGYIEE